jgi:hypothetical protein
MNGISAEKIIELEPSFIKVGISLYFNKNAPNTPF